MDYIFILAISILCGVMFLLGFIIGEKNNIKEELKFPKCSCGDVSQCDTWCIGKENFTRQNG